MKTTQKIDFVVPWVDGSDPEWIKLYNYYRPDKPLSDRGRFRNWDIFKYWFRAVEQYAPWVNKVYLITNGTFPTWINSECPKLVMIRHEDYIPTQFLPTFNSHTIELNMDKIPGLSEHFVYFNDDVFLNAPTKQEDYFVDGLPCDNNAEKIFINPWYDPVDRFNVGIVRYCDIAVINRYFDRRMTVRQAPMKWLGSHLWNKSFFSTLLMSLLGAGGFESFQLPHREQPFLKSVLQEIWTKETEMLVASCTRFRQDVSLNQYVFRYWQFASNKFHPVRYNTGKVISLSESSAEEACRLISEGKIRSICLNDSPCCQEEAFLSIEKKLIETFERKFPKKSGFEK